MKKAVIYARVSSKEQEREGFSIPAQLKLLHESASRNAFSVVKEFIDIETAKASGRQNFEEMVRFLKNNRECGNVLVEKTDRLYRNLRDAVTLEDLDIEIHMVKEGQIISKDAKSHMHTVITNPFYIGNFIWGNKIYRGMHAAFISADLYERVQTVLRSHNKPTYGKQDIAFRGLLTCASNKCTLTAERKKGKYVY